MNPITELNMRLLFAWVIPMSFLFLAGYFFLALGYIFTLICTFVALVSFWFIAPSTKKIFSLVNEAEK